MAKVLCRRFEPGTFPSRSPRAINWSTQTRSDFLYNHPYTSCVFNNQKDSIIYYDQALVKEHTHTQKQQQQQQQQQQQLQLNNRFHSFVFDTHPMDPARNQEKRAYTILNFSVKCKSLSCLIPEGESRPKD
jgi:hypothetical protein